MPRQVKRKALTMRQADPATDGEILFTPRSYDLPLMKAYGITSQEDAVTFTLPFTNRPRTRQGTWVVHRGGGKTLVVIAAVIVPAMLHLSGTYFHVFPTYQQAKKAVWDKKFDEGPQIGREYLDFFRPYAESFNETELQITFRPVNGQRSGSIYQLVGMDTPRQVDLLRSTGPLGVVYDEFQMMPRYAYDVIAARLAQTKGWVLFVGTPTGEDELMKMYDYCVATPGCFAELLTIAQTRKDAPGEDGAPVVPREEVERLRQSGMEEAFIQQELFCSRTGFLHGTIFGEALMRARNEGRICAVPWEVNLPVKTAWDIGRDTTAIWFYQRVGRWFHVIDYAEAKGDAGDLVPMCRLVKEGKPYFYNDHLAPWDLEEQKWGSQESRRSQARRLGVRFRVAKKSSIEDGIAAGRRLLQYCKFDQVKTLKGLDGLGKYRFPWDETNKTFGPEPIHDWASHPGSAFRIFALHPHESNDWIGSEQPKPSHNVTASDVLSLLTQRRDGYNVSAPVLT